MKKVRTVHTHFFFFNFIYLFYLFMAVLGLRFCARAFSSCGKRGPLFIAVRRPLTIVASPVAEHRLQTRRLSRSAACGIFPDQGSNPCALHQQADSQPLHHQGSPTPTFFFVTAQAYSSGGLISLYFTIFPLPTITFSTI